MSLPKLLAATAAGVVTLAAAAFGVAAGRPADPPPQPPPPAARPVTDHERLQGEWLFESATTEQGGDALPGYWDSRLTFRKDTVAISKSPYSEAPVETTFTLDPAARPRRMDWAVPEFYRTLLKLPAGSVRGIYEFDGDALRVCMANKPGGERPTEFKADAAKGHFLFTVRRWTGRPGEPLTEGRVTVLDPDGRPAAGAEVFPFRYRQPEFGDVWKQTTTTTGPDGVGRLPKEALGGRLTARRPDRRLIAFARPTPAGLHHGTTTLRLTSEVRVTGWLTCPELKRAGTAIGWTNVYLQPPDSAVAWAGDAGVDTGRFEFVAPPGEYKLYCYGERVVRKTVPLTVPAGKPEVDAGTVELPATRWGKLIGQPAPELAAVDGWKGEPVTLAGLKGRVVLLHLWEHTQAYTTEPLPELAKLATDFGRKGLRVVGVHVGRGGDVVTAAQFDGVLAKLRADQWGGRDLPFPVALTVGDKGFDDPASGFVSGAISRAAHDYALSPMTFGSTVLIDRKGVVRELFHPKVERGRAVLDKLLAE